MVLNIYTDGGARGNPGPAACAFVAYDSAGNLRAKCGKPLDSFGLAQDKFARGKYLGIATNNEAEYEGVIEALKWLISDLSNLGDLRCLGVNFFLDSVLVANQIRGLFKVKEPRLRDKLVTIRQLENQLSPAAISYTVIPREQNLKADLLVNETLNAQMR